MKRILFSLLYITACNFTAFSQARMGHDAASPVNAAAVLHLGNDLSAAPSNWKALLLPCVSFDNTTQFADSKAWGIAGTPVNGTMVYDTSSRDGDSFKGKGVYVWIDTAWMPLMAALSPVGSLNCSDPTVVGAIGCVSFIYNYQQTTYTTVKAKDNKIWLQQNLGSAQVALASNDAPAYGDYFQWGRWDDGHQVQGTSGIAITPNNPSGVSAGSIKRGTSWWSGGVATDTWSGLTVSATNGQDPCVALGSGWHMPTEAEFMAMTTAEGISSNATAFSSNLKIPAAGYASSSGSINSSGSSAFYWTSTADASGYAVSYYNGDPTHPDGREYGGSIRCVK